MRRYHTARKAGSRGASCFSGRRGPLRSVRHQNSNYAGKENVLRSGICTRKSFLHSFGFVICAGINGYYRHIHEHEEKMEMGRVRAHHKRLEVGPPPLRETVPDLPFVVDAVRRVKLARLAWRREAVVEPALEPVDLVFARLEVVSGPTQIQRRAQDRRQSPPRHRQRRIRQKGDGGTYSLKKAFAICSMRICGCPWSCTTRMPSTVRRIPKSS